MNFFKIGRYIFALGFIGQVVLCGLHRNFIIGRHPGWLTEHGNPLLVYTGAGLILAAAIALLLNKIPVWASLLIGLIVLFYSLLPHIIFYKDDWINMLKTFALVGGACIIAVSYKYNAPPGTPPYPLSYTINKALLFTGTLSFTAFFIASGYAHFKFAAFVFTLIPSFIPFHEFFTYFCGACLIAGGIGLFIPALKKWAALLSAIMISGWFLLLHIPRFFANVHDPSDRLGLCESFTFAGILFVLYAITRKEQTKQNH